MELMEPISKLQVTLNAIISKICSSNSQNEIQPKGDDDDVMKMFPLKTKDSLQSQRSSQQNKSPFLTGKIINLVEFYIRVYTVGLLPNFIQN